MTRTQRAFTAARISLYLGIIAYLGGRVWTERHLLESQLQRLDVGQLVLAEFCVLAGAWLGMLGWRQLITSNGAILSVQNASALYFTSALAKYLPGGLWPAVSLAERGRRFGLSGRHLASAFLLSVALSVVAGLTVGAPALAGTRTDLLWPVVTAAGVLLGAGVLLVAVWGQFRRRPTRGPATALPTTSPSVAAALRRGTPLAFVFILAGWVVSGLHLSVLVAALGHGGARTVVLALCVYALSATAGVMTVVAPAGLGTREVVMGSLLVSYLAEPSVVVAVAASRLLVTSGDVLAAGCVQFVRWRGTVRLQAAKRPSRLRPAQVVDDLS